jgi:hypothetical protein
LSGASFAGRKERRRRRTRERERALDGRLSKSRDVVAGRSDPVVRLHSLVGRSDHVVRSFIRWPEREKKKKNQRERERERERALDGWLSKSRDVVAGRSDHVVRSFIRRPEREKKKNQRERESWLKTKKRKRKNLRWKCQVRV